MELDKSKLHNAGECHNCGLIHTVPAVRMLNHEPEYGNMIKRTPGQEDPLVQEPKK